MLKIQECKSFDHIFLQNHKLFSFRRFQLVTDKEIITQAPSFGAVF